MRRLALAAAVLAASALAAPAPAARVPERGFDLVVSASLPVEPATPTLFVVDPATGRATRLSASTSDTEFSPAPSPDGTRLAFVRDVGGRRSTWVMRADGGPSRLVAAGQDASWAPDGSALALAAPEGVVLASPEGGPSELFAPGARSPGWSPDGRLVSFVTDSAVLAVAPRAGGPVAVVREGVTAYAWAPTGRQVAAIGREPGASLAVVDVHGRVAWRRRAPSPVLAGPSYAPSGERIALSTGTTLVLVDARSGRARRIGLAPYSCSSLAWSPDGRTIACRADRSGVIGDLLLVDVRSGRARVLHRVPWRASGPVAWQRDGSLVVSYESAGPGLELFRIDPDTGRHVRLTTNRASETTPRWSPDGTRLLLWRDRRPVVTGADGRRPHLVPGPTESSGAVAWWPDSAHLLVIDSGLRLRLLRLDGIVTARARIPGTLPSASVSAWDAEVSPDGVVAYSTFEGVWRVAVRQQGSRLVVGTPQLVAPGAFGVRWSPDGRRLLFVRTTDCAYCSDVQVFTTRLGTTREQEVGAGSGLTFRQAAWGPAGERVAVLAYAGLGTTSLRLLPEGAGAQPRTALTGIASLDWRAPTRASGP